MKHDSCEIDHIQHISQMVQAEGIEPCLKALSPRFVSGEAHVDNTDECRDLLPSVHTGHICCRVITGPIGDPITSYQSHVECLQAFIDIVDCKYFIVFPYLCSIAECIIDLTFLNKSCGLVHGNISINNVTIVRFLPNILSVLSTDSIASLSNATIGHPPSPTASQQLLNPPSSTMAMHLDNVDWEKLKPCMENGLPFDLKASRSIINFDYACANNTISANMLVSTSNIFSLVMH